MNKLDGKVAVITGGSTGIGLATAQRFVDEGAHVFITGRRQKELDQAVTQIGKSVTGVQGDVSKLDDLDRLRRCRDTDLRLPVGILIVDQSHSELQVIPALINM